jgi:hypothetical protein
LVRNLLSMKEFASWIAFGIQYLLYCISFLWVQWCYKQLHF